MDESGASGRAPARARRLAVVAVLAAAIVAPIAVAVAPGPAGLGVASADHEPPGTNFTFEPMEAADRHPGAENIRSGTIGQAAPGVETDLETLLEVRSVYSEGSWADCGPERSETFGIDRGSDNERYEVDETLTDNVARFSAGEDVFVTEFHDEDDWGTSTHLNSEDRIFALIECVDNPEEPGWYQIDAASVTGRTADGEEVTYEDSSHYFWICECEDEAEAREELGPPPSEPESTPTATSGTDADGGTDTEPGETTGDGTDGSDGTDGGTGGDRTATPVPEGSSPPDDDATPTGSADSTAVPTPADWNQVRLVTPSRGDGPGFGPVAAIAALWVSALLVWRNGG